MTKPSPGSNRPSKTRYRYGNDPADSFPSGHNWVCMGETYPGSECLVYKHRHSGQTRFYYLE